MDVVASCPCPRSNRKAALEAVAAYHEARLGELVERVGDGVDRFRAGRLDPFEIDRVLFQYSRAAEELWESCNMGDVGYRSNDLSGCAG